MKRSAALAPLSREHHRALVFAWKLLRAGPGEAEDLTGRIPVMFQRDLEPHFQAEEESILDGLRHSKHIDLVSRTLAEHARLRALASPEGIRREGAPEAFAKLLIEHVRFEERELFPAAERFLGLADAEPADAQEREEGQPQGGGADGR
ncbi:MAG: hemerythrin domain-containing protein [Rhodocyclaceae bacterium]|nr:hemerythrin domain-containing protein [Rhodocyclaceae bacterium]